MLPGQVPVARGTSRHRPGSRCRARGARRLWSWWTGAKERGGALVRYAELEGFVDELRQFAAGDGLTWSRSPGRLEREVRAVADGAVERAPLLTHAEQRLGRAGHGHVVRLHLHNPDVLVHRRGELIEAAADIMLTENRRYLGNVLPPVTVFELSKAKARALRERTDKPISNVARSGFTGAY